VSRIDPAKYRDTAAMCRRKATTAHFPNEWIRRADQWEELGEQAETEAWGHSSRIKSAEACQIGTASEVAKSPWREQSLR
jgi:hypothetical protein